VFGFYKHRALTKPSNGRLFRRFFCGLTLRYHKIINYKAAIYGGVIHKEIELTIEEQMIVFFWQVAASLMMGANYFTSDKLRKRVDVYLSQYFLKIQAKVDSEILTSLKYIKINSKLIIASTVMMFSSYYMATFKWQFAIIVNQYIYAFLFIMFLLGFTILIFFLLEKNKPSFLVGLLRPFTTFVLWSTKGPLGAIGFSCLIVSFILQYNYLSYV
jgi:hypothetical protein